MEGNFVIIDRYFDDHALVSRAMNVKTIVINVGLPIGTATHAVRMII
jgi:hypothetical protein